MTGIFIYLFTTKGQATDMPMTVNSKLTHYKIRQISTENKRLKNRQTAVVLLVLCCVIVQNATPPGIMSANYN